MSSHKPDTRTRILETTWQLLEAEPGTAVSMSKIAKASGVSRQALYLHFASRAELLIATTRHVDEVKGLDKRLAKVQQCRSGVEMLQTFIQEWGSYLPEVYGVSKALMISKEADEASAAAWSEIMGCLRDLCVEIVRKLEQENQRASGWNLRSASDLLWTLMSIQNWETLTTECGWNNEEYIERTTRTLMAALVVR